MEYGLIGILNPSDMEFSPEYAACVLAIVSQGYNAASSMMHKVKTSNSRDSILLDKAWQQVSEEAQKLGDVAVHMTNEQLRAHTPVFRGGEIK